MEESFKFSDKVIGVVIEDEINEDTLKGIKSLVNAKASEHHAINLYLEDRYNNGITLTAVLKDLLYEMSHDEPFFKIAVVTDKKLFRSIAKLKNMLLNIKVQSFEQKDRIQAMNWVME